MKCNIIFVILQTAMKDIAVFDRFIGGASRVTIAVHTHPDGDAVGCGIAMTSYLTGMRGKEAALIVPDDIPESISFISNGCGKGKVMVLEREKEEAEAWIRSSDLIICMDCNSFSRTAGMERSLNESGAVKILIDHHLNPETGAFNLVFSKTDISSASELLFWILMETPEIHGEASCLPTECATALLTGMTTDTNNFANSVFPSTLEMASKLIGAGVDRDDILSRLYNNYRENRLRLMGFLMGEKLRITPYGVAYIILDNETQNKFDYRRGENEGFVNMPLSVASVRMSIFLTQEGEIFKVSVRSKKGVSANDCAARYFNGGGHEQAAGGKLAIGKDLSSSQDAEAYILKVTGEFFGI